VPSASAVLRQSILVDTQSRYSVGVAYANPGSSAANVSLSLLNDSGAVVARPASVSMGSGNPTQGFVNQFFTSGVPAVGTMQLKSSTALIAVALRFDATLTKFTTLPAVALVSLVNTGMGWLHDRQGFLPAAVATLLETFRFARG